MLAWTYKWFCYISGRFLYGPWSRFYRWAFERKYKLMPTDLPWDTDQILEFFEKCTWTKDKFYMLWDTISKPERFYKTKKGDCDEYAAFACAVMNKTNFILSVNWYDPRKDHKTFNGHNVCVYYTVRKGWQDISNWGASLTFYKNLTDLALSIIPEGCTPSCWISRIPSSLKYCNGHRF